MKQKGKSQARNQLLQEQLRLANVKEGEQKIRQICAEYVDVFKLPKDKLNATSAVNYIPTPTIPTQQLLCEVIGFLSTIPKEVVLQIQQMLEDEVIQPSQSARNFPILIVPKKLDASGKRKWRICVDFRKLNDITVGDSFPLPNIQNILDKLETARYFSSVDCASGYYQVPLAEEDSAKTAFSTATGHYEYLRMHFGVKSAPSTF